MLYVPSRSASIDTGLAQAQWVAHHFEQRSWLAIELLHGLDDAAWLATAREVSPRTGLRMVAAGDIHMHVRSRKPLQDVLTAIRVGKPLVDCGYELQPNAERHCVRACDWRRFIRGSCWTKRSKSPAAAPSPSTS
ncbi:hypothetical protein [Eleftheria terrae]|uniref:hypothetical protein n=1 Tax=Eleftheria terrae TaxID=1597781 RepID=UPI00263B0296|nr:hypothetical protein [Eleftheria terrae]WKB55787.1 hypothetical protein N7L95_27260 [Eleftheria terrae]